VKNLGYSAAYCPVGAEAADDVVKAYAVAAEKAEIIIAEVGVWNNPISSDEKARQAALEKCREQLTLADRIAARCCVNISGSRGELWDGPSPQNLTDETFDMIVQTTRAIIDDVRPSRTYFTLETMPWAYPDSPDSYLDLLKAIDRKRFAVHLDPVNLVCSPQRYYGSGELIRECFAKLGPYIKSCHAKDILLQTKLTTHLDEIRPGLGGLDYATFLRELSKIPDTPLMLEHLKGAEEYRLAADYVRGVAKSIGLSFG
jgi:sugar phosphate isomerase/epimerase